MIGLHSTNADPWLVETNQNTNLWLVAGSPQDKKMFDGEAAAEGDTTTGDKQETTVDDVDERQRDLNKNNP